VDRIATFVAVAIGSNLGDRRAHVEWAFERLASILHNVKVSTIAETEPVGVTDVQPPFLNAVVVGTTSLGPRELLAELHALERQRGRERPYRWAPRTLDLDLVLHGDLILDEDDITLPHPRFRERRFVLEPLAEVAPEAVDPVTGKTVGELLAALAV
jgi:2-amino-4-hydroxy-6-hydroxymethyldihydropteridine diphosphokinase